MSKLSVFRIACLAAAMAVACKGEEADTKAKAPPPISAQAQQSATPASAVAGGPGAALFNQTCVACHTIGGGDRTGPDLKDVAKRRDKAWLHKWLKDPIGMGQTDPIGKELLAKFKNVPMPAPGFDDQKIDDVLAYIEAESAKPPVLNPVPTLAPAEFAAAKEIYFARCAGCHGTLRAGATGPKITPDVTRTRTLEVLEGILTNGTAAGMPAWGKEGILSPEEIKQIAKFVQMEPPDPPQLPLEKIRESWKLSIEPKDRPKKPQHKRNWENFFGVVLRDAGKVAIIDGDTKEQIAIIATGYAVHILRSSSTGRYFLAVGRDGKVSMIDLWTETPTLVAQAQGCYDARSVDGSKAKGFEDKVIIQGCYWPPQYVIYDGQTLEPKQVTSVLGPTYDTNEPLKEVRVAGIYALHNEPMWALNLKESGYVGFVDYSKPDYPMVQKVAAERFLHDGGWDKSGRYLMVAANMRNQMAIIDTKEKKLVTKFETGNKPHPGRGANWEDPEFGWVNGTVHIGEPKLTIYGIDPVKRPENAWKVVRTVELPAAGGLFLKTHKNSPWVWTDSTLSADPAGPRGLCIYSKKAGKLEKCLTPTERGRVVHFEYNKPGDELWVSVWDKQGELIVYNDKTLEEKQRIKGDWLVTPTGKFNVYNTAHDVY